VKLLFTFTFCLMTIYSFCGLATAQFTVNITSSNSSPLTIGHGTVFSFTIVGQAQAPISATWSFVCGANGIAAIEENTF
jgi:hypothetical protein